MTTHVRLIIGLITLCFVASDSPAHAYSDVFFFGDSFSDTGNFGPSDASAVLPGSFGYDPDRWTNNGGTVWSESFSATLGFASAAVASSDGGNNYAVGGARADELAPQIGSFNADLDGGSADTTALYIILAGGNDMLQGQTPASTVTDVVNSILSLSALGAENILVASIPDLSPLAPGTGPLATGPDGVPIPAGSDVWAQDFNTGLAAAIPGLTGVNVIEFDLASLLNALITDPVGNGFSSGLSLCVNDANCIAGIGTENFLMQDHVHFMSATHELIAAGAIAAIPEPSIALLMGLGLISLSAMRMDRPNRS